MEIKPTREQALALFMKYNKTESLYRHALAVEATMRHFAKLFNEDEDEWGIIGLLHDIDYDMFPEQHCIKVREILEEEHYPEHYIRAIESHGWDELTDKEPITKAEKTLYAIDELTGLISASCLMRPSKSVLDIEVSSVNKKWKDKKFAAGVDRNIILAGMQMLNMEKAEVIEQTILGMRAVAEAIGLKGNL